MIRIKRFTDNDTILGYLFLAPIIIWVLGLVAYPFFTGVKLSLSEKFVGYPPKFVGFRNFVELWHDGFFRRTVGNSFVFTVGSVVFKLLFGMIMAMVINQKIMARNFFRGILYVPWIAPTVVTATAWLWMYDAVKGVFNISLVRMGVMDQKIAWLSDPTLAMMAVITVNVWRGFPFFGISLLAALQNIPRELYEAAEVDGASAAQKFWYITIPGLKHVIGICVLLSTIWTFNDFNIIFLMTRGGPAGATQVFATLAYEYAFARMRWGSGVAVSISLLPLLLLAIILLARHLRREQNA